jgi:succinate dehydrogenase / fumarate reductase cytochrome b subunit
MQSESSLILTLRESIRYRGLWGHWSWLAHRLSGLAVLLFLVIHVWDTANATFWPEAYAYTVEIFKWFPFSVGEIGLMAAVLYHAFNGIRITLLDFKPDWWRYQRQSTVVVWVLFTVVFIPIAIFMLSRTIGHCTDMAAAGQSCFSFPTP